MVNVFMCDLYGPTVLRPISDASLSTITQSTNDPIEHHFAADMAMRFAFAPVNSLGASAFGAVPEPDRPRLAGAPGNIVSRCRHADGVGQEKNDESVQQQSCHR
ncbi:MAG: hypothetical protein ACKVP4_05370 [Hyphomicrobium sp.]